MTMEITLKSELYNIKTDEIQESLAKGQSIYLYMKQEM